MVLSGLVEQNDVINVLGDWTIPKQIKLLLKKSHYIPEAEKKIFCTHYSFLFIAKAVTVFLRIFILKDAIHTRRSTNEKEL